MWCVEEEVPDGGSMLNIDNAKHRRLKLGTDWQLIM